MDAPSNALIDGEWVSAEDGSFFEVTDPATDELVARVANCGVVETRRALEAAAAAWPSWKALTAADRAARLHRFHDLMKEERDALADLMCREQGKPLAEARGEIDYAAGFLAWAAEEGRRIYGETIPASHPEKRMLVLRQPVGVTVAITPWNFPSAMITRKLGPALAAGCVMVVKPAEQTPLSALALGRLALRAGIPRGVFSVVPTNRPEEVGLELTQNPLVRKISFTGSTEVGRILMRQAAENIVRISLELGGHAPTIVFDDADLDVAVQGAMASKFRNAGQTCVCANRIYVQEGIYDRFVARMGEAVGALRVGSGREDGVHVGPLIDDAAVEKVEAHVADAREKGAKVVVGGRRVGRPGLSDRFFAPTLLEGVRPEMLVMKEETFGPIAPVARFRTEEEVIGMANDTSYGLAAYFFTRDASRLMRVAEALEYGIVGANDGLPSAVQAPFGGFKQSGIGREGGKYVMNEYLEIKYVSWAL
jgi:succinate-semialdehyde dehydrogenase/glutarate-semialdehyde dehydrogenase